MLRSLPRLLLASALFLGSAAPAWAGYSIDDVLRASLKGMPEDTVVLMADNVEGEPLDSAQVVLLLRAGLSARAMEALTDGAHPTPEELAEAAEPGPAYELENAPEARAQVKEIPRLRVEGCQELFPIRSGPKGYGAARWGMSQTEVLSAESDERIRESQHSFGPLADQATFLSYEDEVYRLPVEVILRLNQIKDCPTRVLTGARVTFTGEPITEDQALDFAEAVQRKLGKTERLAAPGFRIVWYQWKWPGISLYWHKSGHMSLTHSSEAAIDLDIVELE